MQTLLSVLLILAVFSIVSWWRRIYEWILRQLFCPPDIQSFRAEINQVELYKFQNQCWVSLGRKDLPLAQHRAGIYFNAVGVPQQNCPGTLEWVQIVKPGRMVKRNLDGIDMCKYLHTNDWVLDGQDPYGGLTHRANRGLFIWDDVSDTPGQACSVPLVNDKIWVSDRFRTFLMWRPDRFGGRFRIPLGHIDWWWYVHVKREPHTATCSEGGENAWQLVASAYEARATEDLITQPSWTGTLAAVQWRDC